MKNISLGLLLAIVTLVGVAAFLVPASGQATAEPAARFVTEIPAGYRNWQLISVAREEAPLDDIRAILGNESAVKAYREGKTLPDGAIIARLAWQLVSSPENDTAFGMKQSFVAGAPKNGVQFMIKDAKRYAATGGWGYGHFENGKSASDAMLATCFPCHQRVAGRDFVFTRYSP